MLNRLNITGNIDSSTPKCVLEEICKCSSIKFKRENETSEYICKTIYKIYSYPGTRITNDFERDDLRLIARFVNPDHKGWKKESLLKAYNFLISFDEPMNDNFIIGQQTPEFPESLNACVLYKLCKKYSLNVDFKTSIDNMAIMIKLYHSTQIHDLKINIHNFLKYYSKPSDIVNIMKRKSVV